jgi:hypothetical protein
MALLNPRTLGVTAARDSRDAHEAMWNAFARLHVGVALLPDTGLVNPSVDDPESSLRKAQTIAKFAWRNRRAIFTHGQGAPGLLRPAVGGTMVALDDAMSRMTGPSIEDPRGWGRFTGRLLIGKEGTSVIVITAYFPCTSSKNSPGSAWQTQLALLPTVPEEERQRDPWFQALADLQKTIWLLLHEGASARILAGRHVILAGDFNARWINPKPEASTSQQRTRALRAFAGLLGLAEAISTLHPMVRPVTFCKSSAPDSPTSWIDFFLVSAPLLDSGIISEAGVLQHEVLNASDHRLYAIDVNISALLHTGPEWQHTPVAKDPRLSKLPLNSAPTSSQYQCDAAKLWTANQGGQKLQSAQDAVVTWLATRDHAADEAGASDWGEVDPGILLHLDLVFETLVSSTVGAWRKARNCLPSYQLTGCKRKDGWSVVFVQKARNLRCLLDVSSMWQRNTFSREAILHRASDLQGMSNTLGSAPSPNAYHVEWRQWIAHVRSRVPILRGELHGVDRKRMQTQMQEAIQKRDERWAAGRKRQCIASWLQRA